MSFREKWSIADLANAMENSVRNHANSKFVKITNDKLTFNGFWRNGNKPNACIWLKKATWADAKTGEGGGCKKFAQIAFNLSFVEFMERFGPAYRSSVKPSKTAIKSMACISAVNDIWLKLNEKNGKDCLQAAEQWLKKARGFESPRDYIGSGFTSLEKEDIYLFNAQHQGFLKYQLAMGQQLVVPIRSVHSSKVKNLFFRTIDFKSKEQKSRLLPGLGGWSEEDSSPRAFGFPHLINDFPTLILCEGMADYFAVECLLGHDDNFLPIGAANASALCTWALWLAATKYRGKVIILYQLDLDSSGQVSVQGVGQTKAMQALKILLQAKIVALLFKWPSFLRLIKAQEHSPNDIADLCKIYGSKAISEQFLTTLQEVH